MADNHYIKNKDLFEALKDWREESYLPWLSRKKEAKALGQKFTELRPPATDFIATSIYSIASKYARKPNFSGYTYIEDMISEGVMLCLRYMHNFNPEKSNNAFSYFTQICHNAFLQMIKRENKLVEFKFNMVKSQNEQMGRNDFRDIKLSDESDEEDLTTFFDVDDEEVVEEQEPNYEEIAENSLYDE